MLNSQAAKLNFRLKKNRHQINDNDLQINEIDHGMPSSIRLSDLIAMKKLQKLKRK